MVVVDPGAFVGGRRTATAASDAESGLVGEREFIVIADANAGLRAGEEGIRSIVGADVDLLARMLAENDLSLLPVFDVPFEYMRSD